MGNTIPGTITKLLTLLPILAAVYFFDFPKFFALLTSSGQGAFFFVAISLFALGAFLKRKILRARLELSSISFTWGLPLLGVAALLYFYGSYSSDTVWYHYESFFALVVGYVALRIGTGILRSLVPLLAILVLALPPVGFFPGLTDQAIVAFLCADLTFVFFLVFVGLRMNAMVIPVAVIVLGLFAWNEPTSLLFGRQLDQVLLIPAPLLVLLVPRIRGFVSLPNGAPAVKYHEHHLRSDGFCSICGSKLSRARTGENIGIWGFLAVVVVAALIILSAVPALVLTDGVPYDAYYTSHGYSGTITPTTPTGWQINSTAVYKSGSVTNPDFATDVYAIKQVYVPLYHPETANYTMYYELADVSPPYSNVTFGGDIPGWNRTANVFIQIGPLQGHLATYVASNEVMLAYQGTTSMLFLNGGAFQGYFVGIGFIREFKNSNVNLDTTQFLGDLNALWLPGITKDSTYSGWTNFLYVLDQGSLFTSTFLILASSMIAIIWVAYRASVLDERLDRFLTMASAQSEENWWYLTGLLKRPHHAGTGQELALAENISTPADVERMASSLGELEKRRLVRRSLIERGADIVSVWRAVV